MSSATALTLAAALVILATLFEMLRRHRLREKYALAWFLIALAALTSALFPGLVAAITELLGVAVPANLAFFAATLVLFLMTLQHSSDLGRLEERTRTLAEEVAVLRLELDQVDHGTGTAADVPRPPADDEA